MVSARRRPIGVFDSGVGGLTVLDALRERLPEEDFVYLGDTARLPYGTKSPDTVSRYAQQAAAKLVEREVKLLVVACNTASAVAVESLQRAFSPIPVVGVVEPGAEAACAATRTGHVLVTGTEGTVEGGAYTRAILSRNPKLRVDAVACPMFVALAEEDWTNGPIAEAVARRYLELELAGAERSRVDTIVLGCTHFPLLREAIARVCGPGVALVDSAHTAAVAVERELGQRGLRRLARREGEPAPVLTFLATDAPARFSRVGAVFLGHHIDSADVELVDL